MRDLRAKDPEKHREYARRYRAAHVEKYREATRRWKARNREKTRDYARKRYAANPEKYRQIARDWRAANPAKHREVRRKHYLTNAEKIRKRARAYHRAHPEKQRERDRKRHQRERDILRAARQAAKLRKRGRQPGPDKPTTARSVRRQERIDMAAAFGKLGWSERAMSRFVFKETPASAYSNMRNFISDYRVEFEEKKANMTLSDAKKVVEAAGAPSQAP